MTALVAVVALAMAVTTLPRSGPYCSSGCVGYPYTDVAAFVPRDYLWMYPAIVLTLLFVVLVAAVHDLAALPAKVYSRTALAFAVIAASALVLDYAIQLTVMQPSLVKGETEGLSAFSQYNPHGVFIALENVGYLAMSLAFLFVAVAFRGRTGLQRGIRWVFATGGVLTVVALVVYAVIYGSDLDYRFEVAAIGIAWLVLIVAGILLSLQFRRSAAAVTTSARG